MTARVTAAGRTHIGLLKSRNEDSYYVGDSLFAVADGLGGHVAGDIASATVIETVRAHDHALATADPSAIVGRMVKDANDALSRRISIEPQKAGMGSTLVAMLWAGSTAVLANIGDSRAYLRRRRTTDTCETLQITEDHNYEHLVASAASVPRLPERMARWLDGRHDGRSPDLTTWDLEPGDRFLLCTDGLSVAVPHHLIDATLKASSHPDETADQLITLALDRGGPDNVTVIVVDVL